MKQLITKFYSAFALHDAATMADCYHPHADFTDEVFVHLKGKEPGMMWKMLVERSKDQLMIQFSNVQVLGDKGSADWVASYVFSATGRNVINHIHAEFEFKDGLIYRHKDSFDLHKWAAQAMGWKGQLLGGFGFFKRQIQKQARQSLNKYIQKQDLLA